jgi:SAM-dependent methyltransferase
MGFFTHFAPVKPTAPGAWLTRMTVEQEFRFLREHLSLSPEAPVLEIGPGQGELAALFCKAGHRSYDIVEPDDGLREGCRRLPLRNVFADIVPPLPVADGSYALVIMCDVFEHMNDSRVAGQMIGEVVRVLRPGGSLFVLCPDYLHWKEEFYNCDFSHSNPTTVRRMNQLFFNHGLETVATMYHYCFMTGAAGFLAGTMVRLATWPFVGAGADINSRLYRLRLCFLRRFLMIGRKR